MRRTAFFSLTLLVGTLGIAAACSEQQPSSPTAPAARAAGITTSQSDATGPASPAARPAPTPVGFTKITEVKTGPFMIAAGNFGGGTATCPAGTTTISGGYDFGGYSVTNYPWVRESKMVLGGSGWTIFVINQTAGAADASVWVYAYCAS